MFKKRRLKSMIRFLIRSKRNPEALARGLGIGVFVGFLPSIGFQIVLALLLAGFFGGNRVAAAIGTFVTNPITAIPVSAFSLWLGDWILPGARLSEITMTDFSLKQIIESPGELFASFLVGCVVLGAIGGILSYIAMQAYYNKRADSLRQ